MPFTFKVRLTSMRWYRHHACASASDPARHPGASFGSMASHSPNQMGASAGCKRSLQPPMVIELWPLTAVTQYITPEYTSGMESALKASCWAFTKQAFEDLACYSYLGHMRSQRPS